LQFHVRLCLPDHPYRTHIWELNLYIPHATHSDPPTYRQKNRCPTLFLSVQKGDEVG
jgi:hypothetical protein